MALYYLLLPPVALTAGLLIYTLYCWKVNYDAARASGLPVILLPVDSANPLWMILDAKVTAFFRRIPFCSGNFTRFNWRGWEIYDRYKAHHELGDALLFVTPGKIYLHINDSDAVAEIFSRRLDFDRPPEVVAMLKVFGPNLGTVEGQQWQKHRKITASSFNENVFKSVWNESIRQALGLIEHWSAEPSVDTVASDTRTVSLHVMSGAAFGQSYPFRPSHEGLDLLSKEGSVSYGDALRVILDRCIPLLVLGQKNLGIPWLPRSFRELYQATLTFQKHMTQAYEAEKLAMDRGETQTHTLMTSLVRSSRGDAKDGLTEKEIYGNIFVYNFAGHDATANSLAYAVFLIASRPDIQDWISEEIRHVLLGQKSEDTVYEHIFPRLKRCLAVVHETVRLFTAVGIAKSTGNKSQPLTVNGKTVIVPKGTMVVVSYAALHTDPRHWGDDSLSFKPSRWIESSGGPGAAAAGATSLSLDATLKAEQFKEPAKNDAHFVGWSGGVRSCPGRKFSQVEFVAVLVGLFRDHKVRPMQQPGESEAAACRRLNDQVWRQSGYKLLLQILNPENLVLKWEKR